MLSSKHITRSVGGERFTHWTLILSFPLSVKWERWQNSSMVSSQALKSWNTLSFCQVKWTKLC